MENIKLNFIHVCENAIIANDGKISVIGVFNKIRVEGLPAAHPRFSIVTNISGPVGVHKETIKILSPKGETIAQSEKDVEIKGEGYVANLITDLINVVFPIEGKYKIAIFVDGNLIDDQGFIVIRLNN